MNKRALIVVVGLVLILVGYKWSRFSRDTGEPVSLLESPGIWVQLGQGYPNPGQVCQFFDDVSLSGVIALTSYPDFAQLETSGPRNYPLETGRRIDLIMKETEKQSFSLSWMSAGQRITLGIPLHPDKMTQRDWEYLPGVGAKMAARIEEDRQKNGEFGSLVGLLRIKGIGPSKIAAWEQYF